MAEEFLPLNPAEEYEDTSWYTAAAAGIASGILKVPEGVFSLAAELIDLGADTNTAASVESFFDKWNPFEEVAEERAIGKLTEALVQIGIPGGIGYKMANKAARNLTAKALRAKRAGTYANLKGKGVHQAMGKVKAFNEKAKYGRFAAGVMGGAAGEAFVADIEQIGSFGDMFESGPTQIDRDERFGGREDATRKLLNRIKFGSESLLLAPFVMGAGKSAKLLANKSKDLAYSNSKFGRWLDKYIRAPLSPRGHLSDELFSSERLKEALKANDIHRAQEIIENITKQVDGIFPSTQTMFDKSTRADKQRFMKGLNEILFEGDLKKTVNPKKLDDLLDLMKKNNVDGESRGLIVNGLNDAREEFTKLLDILADSNKGAKLGKGAKELQELLSDRVTNWIGGTYKIFENQGGGIFKFFRRYNPTDEAYTNGINFFRAQIAKQNGDLNFNPAGNKYTQEARQQVESLLNAVSKKKQPKPLDFNNYISKTVEGKPGGDFIKQVIDDTGMVPREIRELLGEVQDPRYSIFNAITNLSSVTRTASYLSEVAAKNAEVQAKGQRGFFWSSKEAGEKAVDSLKTDIDIVPMDALVKQLPGAGKTSNPLATMWTTKEIADGIKNANHLAGGLQGFVRGEGAEGAEAVASWMWRNLLLFPKGISQLTKTVFSIPTHLRNMFSAIGFSGANGILFENPKLVAKAFKEGIDISGLMKLGSNSPRAQKAYRELVELGLVNQQVQIGDIKNLFRDIKFGEQAANVDSVLRPFMSRMKSIGKWFQGKYVAEDDTFKITNWVVELDRLKRVAVKKGLDVADPAVLRSLKVEAADIVKNTVPNYAFVGSAVRTARLLPIGNFMSFPSEMIRTTSNIAELGIKEMKHSRPTKGSNVLPVVFDIEKNAFVKNDNLSYGTGFKRLLGMATFTAGAPIALTEGAKALYDVTQEELDALRRFVPEWSKNSTLIPTRNDDGELMYLDFSHSNAYDIIARPLKTLLNNIQDGEMNDQVLLESFINGAVEAGGEIMNPFISESIWTEAASDLIIRGGRTKEGRPLYTDQTTAGDKAKIKVMHLAKALLPPVKPYERVYQAMTETPTGRGEVLEIGPQLGGLMGLRSIKVDPERSMGFKIAQYQTGIRNARREFTGGFFGLLKGGPVHPNEIISRFAKSNKARFEVQQEMYNDLGAAEVLGLSRGQLRNQFEDRQLNRRAFTGLINGRFEPYYPSKDIEDRFREIAVDLGDENAFNEARPVLKQMLSEMRQLNLDEQFLIDMSDYYIEDIETPPLPQSVTSAMPNNQTITQGQNILNQAMNTGTATQNGLTASENEFLSEEEKMMRLKNRGMTT